jgi:hypothetical protein
MAQDVTQQSRNHWSALRRFAQPRPPAERCELCSLPLAEEHEHLLEMPAQQLLCACGACAILFSNRSDGRYRRVPRRLRLLDEFAISDAQWDSLAVPIGLAFFFHSTTAGRMAAVYPSPAGPMQSLLDLEGWQEIVAENAALETLEPDVETLLVNRIGTRRDYFLAPIDQCYRLTGLIRSAWRGLSGGPRVWQEIDAFFENMKQRATRRTTICRS